MPIKIVVLGLAAVSLLVATGIALAGADGVASASRPPANLTRLGSVPLPHSPRMPLDTPTGTPTNTPDPCAPVWSVVSSPNGGTGYNELDGLAVVSASDVWAVGYYCNVCGINETDQTLVEHWDGTSWSVVPSPNVGTGDNFLSGVAAVSANDVWAVGRYYNGSPYQALVEHWDGTSWSVVPSPNMGTSRNELHGVVAVSANDVWAVGYYCSNPYNCHTLAEHWDGTSWSVVPSPNVGTGDNVLSGVAAVSANDVWAVGYYDGDGVHTLVEHWDGISWSVVPSPNPTPAFSELYEVAAVSANDVWAVGVSYDSPPYSPSRTLVEHWDGTSWSVVPSPNVGTNGNRLQGVAAVSASDVWAVGDYVNGTGWGETLVEHWNGTSWSVMSSPNGGTSVNGLNGVAAVSASDLWAVGHYSSGAAGQTLVEHYESPCAPAPTSTPTTTNTPTPVIVSHVTWQGRSPQPNILQQLPITLTLKSAAGETNYPIQNTDSSGFFTDTITGLPGGLYLWRVDGPKYLANSGTVAITGASIINAEMGLMKVGDCNDDNVVNSVDFVILKTTFGKMVGQPGYDARADFNGDDVITAVDVALQRSNFGQAGPPPIGPVR